MSNENPYQPSEAEPAPELDSTKRVSSGRAAYNVFSDTVTGVNARKSDNKFQALFIAASIPIFAIIGAVVVLFNPRWLIPWLGGAVFGAFAGLLVGVFASGTVLMFYRGKRHLDGKHD